jgi:hypothetical protein
MIVRHMPRSGHHIPLFAVALLHACSCDGDPKPPADAGMPPPDSGCAAGLEVCGDECVDVRTSVDHCGGCRSACPIIDVECRERTCIDRQCGARAIPQGTVLASQITGDCLLRVCSSSGEVTARLDQNDRPLTDGNSCTRERCSPEGAPEHLPRVRGSTCAQDGRRGYCDGMSPSPLCLPCVEHEPGSRDVLLAFAPTDAASMSSAFDRGVWTSTAIGARVDRFAGGVEVTPGGAGVMLGRGDSDELLHAEWDGCWSSFERIGVQRALSISAPVRTSSGAFAAYNSPAGVRVTWYSDQDRRWGSFEDVPTATGNRALAVAFTSAGEPMILFSSNAYEWTVRRAGGWSASAAIAGVTPPSTARNRVLVVARAGGDLLAVFAGEAATLAYATYAGGAWSAASPFAERLNATISAEMLALAALPDGRAVFAAVSELERIYVAFFDGAAWSELREVPNVSVPRGVALARGAGGLSVLEVVYLDDQGGARHLRLVDEAGWLWTDWIRPLQEPVTAVHLAVAP